MIQVTIPGDKEIKIAHVVFDYNGTIARDGKLLAGVKEGIAAFSEQLTFHVITADTFGSVAKELQGVKALLTVIPKENQAEAKCDYIETLGSEETLGVGNGANDCLMLKAAALGIAVLGDEGLAAASLASADIVLKDILDLFGFFKRPERLIATLRR